MESSFSVAMCTRNGARFIDEQLVSIASQTLLPKELIVCDDCSTDGTVAVLERFAAHAPFPVSINVNANNLGIVKNFERAIGLCNEELIALCDQDDVWKRHKLERLASEFARSPDVGLVFSDAELIDENSRSMGRTLWESIGVRYRNQQLSQGRALTELLAGSTVTGATTAFRSRFKNLVLPIPDNLLVIHDGWLALMIGAVATISAVAEPLVEYRQHREQEVGARARIDSASGVRAALNRPNPYVETLAIVRALRQRLEATNDSFDVHEVLTDLNGRIAHLEARAALPKGLMRVGTVLKELFTLRYHRYSNGTYSAIKDLLA